MANAKRTTVFFCSSCGYESSKWLGQCPGCREWNTFVEENVGKPSGSGAARRGSASGSNVPARLSEIELENEERILTGIEEFDRVLGGGIVPGSLVLVGGDPGIGKSTLLLQVCRELSIRGNDILYVSGEESKKQIKMRALRLGDFNDRLTVFCETDLDVVSETISRYKPRVAVVDSIQTMYCDSVSSAPGSVSQVREAASVLLRLSKSLNIAIFIVGHVTKEGMVAGPRVLEHIVDSVLYFEGDRYASYRILRGVKNRFGSTNEIGVFEMCPEGLMQVRNPSEYLLSGRPQDASGSVVACAMEGSRPVLLEIQALVSKTSFGFPKRQATGADINRLNLLMAVLEKRLGLKTSECDAYVNVAGGMKMVEPAMDLGIVMAVVSSFRNRAIPGDVMVFGEVGLSGEIRNVSMPELRVQEAKKLGFTTCIMPETALSHAGSIEGIELKGVKNLSEALTLIG
ncbi:MAG TPA: DNA repair protein RadA [Lachnospiraceae bacterium]|nr:DNA repair protein RadA [Lachnospiraceae bacterium]